MSDAGPARLLPLRDRRQLLTRQEELADAAMAVDAEQQRLAVEFARLRVELESIREQLWPSSDGHAYAKTQRPRVGGPTPVPPAAVDAMPLRGRALRDAALRTLLRADGPLTLAEIHRALHLGGHVLLAADPVKQLGDALGYEERRGVVRRIARGTYALGTLTPYRRRVLETPTASRRSPP
jgi:hypothetical protein